MNEDKPKKFRATTKLWFYLGGLAGLLAFIGISAWWDLTFGEFNLVDFIADTLILIAIALATMVLSDLLAEEGLDAGDLAVAATGDYERNLVMAAYLKSRGARRTIALTASAEFDDIARKLGVDVTVPLRDVVVDAISGHLRGTAVRAVHSVCDRLFEIIECDILAGSRAAGKTLRQIAAPGEYLVLLSAGAGQSALAIPGGETILATGGRAVLVARAGGRRAERLLAAHG